MPLTRREPRAQTARSEQREKVLADMAKAGKRSKYRAVRCEVDGEKFDSKREMNRWLLLRRMEQAGWIGGLERQKEYPLSVVTSEYVSIIGSYVADFDYIDMATEAHKVVTEDCKGFRTDLYRWKKKHFEAQYGRKILET